MAVRREEQVRGRIEALLRDLARDGGARYGPDPRISREDALACLEASFQSRLLDLEARELKNRGAGYYTIGSMGHEINAVLGQLLRLTDPCLLHYRSGALIAARKQRACGETFLYDTLASFVASSDEPVSHGRHKVWGSKSLWVIPQTSTIASHLPKALGMAYSITRAKRLGLELAIPLDSIVVCSFGDASVNHASATTAFNAACWATHQNIPVPILFVCEDNGFGISVHTPKGWIEDTFGDRDGIEYYRADGRDLPQSFAVANAAIDRCRTARRPVFLHLDVVRLLGHAGSDVETTYQEESEIVANEQRDPLVSVIRFVVDAGYATGSELLDLYGSIAGRIDRIAAKVVTRPKLDSRAAVIAPLAFPEPAALAAELARTPDPAERARTFEHKLPEDERPRHMAMLISWALADLMSLYSEMIVFGEDVAKKGGVYHLTTGLYDRFGVGRVFNTLLDETMILGTAIGAAQIGFLPVPEIQYLAYYHNAEDQLRGEACSQRFFSGDEWDNPMVVRIAAFGYQKGFGGHFHNDNSIAVLRDVPGLILAVPSRGDDAVGILRTCVAAARSARRVSVVLEPIALYMTKDLHEKGDGEWSFRYPAPGTGVPLGQPRLYAAKIPRVLVASFGNGVPMALQARRLAQLEDVVEVMDLRWLAPLPVAEFLEAVRRAVAVVVLDECRASGGGVSEALLAAIAQDDECRGTPVRRIAAADSYVPIGPAADLVLPGVDDVVVALRELLPVDVNKES